MCIRIMAENVNFFMEGTEGRMSGMAGGSYGENRNVKI